MSLKIKFESTSKVEYSQHGKTQSLKPNNQTLKIVCIRPARPLSDLQGKHPAFCFAESIRWMQLHPLGIAIVLVLWQ